MRPPKPLNIPGSASPPIPTGNTGGRTPRPLAVSPGASAGAPNTPNSPRSIPLGGVANPKVDGLISAALTADPSLISFKFRLKPRFDDLLTMDDDDLLNWGRRNLTALGSVTHEKSKIAADIARINPGDWIERCANAACRPPSLMSKLFGSPETPQFFQTRISQMRDELMVVIKELRRLHEEVSPDVEDLRMDIAALQTFVTTEQRFDPILADGRLRTLITAQQTVIMAMTAIDQFRITCAKYIETIDNLLQVTIPNWEIATSQR